MRRFFVKNILFVLAVNILVKPIWVFFIDRNVQNRVPGGDYGTYQALMSLSIIFQTLLDFGITNYNSRTISQNPDKLSTLFPAMLSTRFVLMGAYLAIALAGGWLLGYRGWEMWLLCGVLLIQALNALLGFIRSNISALHYFKTDGLLSIADRLLMVLICGFLLLYPATAAHFKIEWFILTQICCYGIATGIGYVILRRLARTKLKFVIRKDEVLSIFKQSFPYALLVFQMSIYNRADAMMIERMCKDGKAQADVWAAAFRLLEVSNMVGLMFGSMLLPLFGRMLSEKKDVNPILKTSVNMLLPLSVMVAVAASLYAGKIMPMLYKNSNQEYEIVFSVLMASFPAWCMMYVYSTLLTANGSLKHLNMIAFFGILFNLSFNFYLIPGNAGAQFAGAAGGSLISCATQTLLAIVFIIVAWRILHLQTTVRWLGAHIGFILLIVILGNVLQRFLPLSWMIQLGVFGSICVALMFVFRFVSMASIKKLMSRQ
jgi:O-antigen/teichoic acid export membrane protein